MLDIYSKLGVVEKPIDTFFFDWDGTLVSIEGIDALAAMNGVAEKVHAITERCMATTGLTLADYRERLFYVQPTKSQLDALVELYRVSITPGANEVIQVLHKLKKKVYIISAGIKSVIVKLAPNMGIKPDRVLAVDVYFDEQGNYKGFNEHSVLTQAQGKRLQITATLNANERSLLIGDGFNDWEARMAVSRFIGYAGLHGKTWLRKHSDIYISNASLYSILPLGLTQEERLTLSTKDKSYYELGLADIRKGVVLIKEHNHVQRTTFG